MDLLFSHDLSCSLMKYLSTVRKILGCWGISFLSRIPCRLCAGACGCVIGYGKRLLSLCFLGWEMKCMQETCTCPCALASRSCIACIGLAVKRALQES